MGSAALACRSPVRTSNPLAGGSNPPGRIVSTSDHHSAYLAKAIAALTPEGHRRVDELLEQLGEAAGNHEAVALFATARRAETDLGPTAPRRGWSTTHSLPRRARRPARRIPDDSRSRDPRRRRRLGERRRRAAGGRSPPRGLTARPPRSPAVRERLSRPAWHVVVACIGLGLWLAGVVVISLAREAAKWAGAPSRSLTAGDRGGLAVSPRGGLRPPAARRRRSPSRRRRRGSLDPESSGTPASRTSSSPRESVRRGPASSPAPVGPRSVSALRAVAKSATASWFPRPRRAVPGARRLVDDPRA